MTQHHGNAPSPISNLRRGTTRVRDEMHLTGGLRSHRAGSGWMIGPFSAPQGLGEIGEVPDSGVARIAAELGVMAFGVEEISETDPNLPSRIWRPLFGLPQLKHQPADTWGMITSSAHRGGDPAFAMLARYISISIRSAGLQLRNASNEYHRQLFAALSSGQSVGRRFSNVPLSDLHLSFHSLLSEMGSTRDYLAQMAARRVNAPTKIDALNRLTDWLGKRANASAASDPLIAALLQAIDTSGPDPWLHDVGEYRNLFLHREPLGANDHARWLKLTEASSRYGLVLQLTLEIGLRPGNPQTCDGLSRFVDLHDQLCRLADFAATLAPFPAEPPAFVAIGD